MVSLSLFVGEFYLIRATEHPLCPENGEYVRVPSYNSSMVILPHKTFDEVRNKLPTSTKIDIHVPGMTPVKNTCTCHLKSNHTLLASDIPQFSDSAWFGKYLKNTKHSSLHLTCMLRYLSLDIICSSNLTVFALQNNITSVDKVPSICFMQCSHQDFALGSARAPSAEK